MPKRASCHHCMRRARSASSEAELLGAWDSTGAAVALAEAARVRRDAPVPTSQSRRGMPFGFMSCSPPVLILPIGLLLELKDSLHQQPLFAGFGLLQRLLEFPHQFFPLTNSGICAVGCCFGVERKYCVYFHDHEHAGTE